MTILNYVHILLCPLVLAYLLFIHFISYFFFLDDAFYQTILSHILFCSLRLSFYFLVITSLLKTPYFIYLFQLPTLLERLPFFYICPTYFTCTLSFFFLEHFSFS